MHKARSHQQTKHLTRTFPHYHLLAPAEMEWTRGRTIGRGSSATVSLATSYSSGDSFAVKSVDLDRSESLQREQSILSSLSSPHVVSYKGAEITREGGSGSTNLVFNLLMEYVAGGTLADEIHRQEGALDEPIIAIYACQIVRGLSYLHSIGLAHCDIKCHNILVGEDGAKIGDLGCAKWIDSRPSCSDLEGYELDREAEEAMPISGTPAFMAPEVARGEEQGCPADVWALGCSIIEMATGESPWPEMKDPISVLYRVGFAGESPDIPTSLSEQGKDFLSRCLIRDPRERWTANQLLKHPFLEEFDSKSNILQKPTSNSSPTTVLDNDFWEEIEESQDQGNVIQTSSLESPARRFKQLFSFSGNPRWDWEENWITVRNSNEINDSISGSSAQEHEINTESFDFLSLGCDSYVNSSRFRNYCKDSVAFCDLNLERHSFIQYEAI